MRLLATLFLLLLGAVPAPATAAPVVGVYSEEAPTQTMRQAGVESTRRPWSWKLIEPRRGVFDFALHDAWVAAAARRNLTILPFLGEPPAWAARQPAGERGWRPPRDPADFARFATAAVRRWGPGGTFWAANPKLPYHPIRAWQVWNEPNLPVFWRPEPDAAAYVRLLAPAAAAIHAADPAATVVAAGLPESQGGIPQTQYLQQMYAAGVKGVADALAIHAYAPDTAGVAALVTHMRTTMDARGDGSPIWVTEFGWATAGEASLFTTTEALQALFVGQSLYTLRVLAAPLRLDGLFVFRWQDVPRQADSFDVWPFHSGLVRVDGVGKAGLAAFAAASAAALPATSATVARPVRLRVRRAGRRAVRVRCSRACQASLVLYERVPREGRIPQQIVRARRERALPAARWRRVRLGRLAGRELTVTALTPEGAVRVSRSYPRRGRR